jgi:hypothetical protein
MATKRHQFIVGLIIKQMKELGYEIKAVEGLKPGLLEESISLPPRVIN